ncbi:MAG: DUF4921 family protein [Patescibacteria group bacterium]
MENQELSELRQDLISGDWIVVAPKRGNRPHELETKKSRKRAPKSTCPFEHKQLETVKPILRIGDERDWNVIIIPNKFPAFTHHGVCPVIHEKGPFLVTEGIGHHDIVVMRDHDTDFASVPLEEAVGVFQAFRGRYQTMLQEECISYVSMFHNWGASAGASLYHPHFQIISIPVIPPDIRHSLVGSHEYFKNHGQCVHCALVEWELKEGKRIIVENEHAIAITPFTSRTNFEIRVFPKRHLPYFEDTPPGEIASVVQVLHQALGLMRKTLNDPDYNFFIHTSPVKDKEKYEHYHWHIEIVPKTNIDAGFELGTGIDIISVNPDDAANMFKQNRV